MGEPRRPVTLPVMAAVLPAGGVAAVMVTVPAAGDAAGLAAGGGAGDAAGWMAGLTYTVRMPVVRSRVTETTSAALRLAG